MNLKKINSQTMSVDKAWLLGLIAGDGHVSFRPSLRTYAVVIAAGLDEPLAREALRCVEVVYGLTGRVKKVKNCWTAFVYSKALVDDLRALALFGAHRWTVPATVTTSDDIKAHWVAGLVDADGHIAYRPKKGVRYVSIDSVNESGLRATQTLLASIGVDATIYKDRSAFRLVVGHREAFGRFAEIVPVRCPRKKACLSEAARTYTKRQRRRCEVDRIVPEIRRRLADRESYREIGEALGMSSEQVRSAARTHGVLGPGRGKGAIFQYLEKHWPEVERRIASGQTIPEVAAAIGVEPYTIQNGMKTRGLRVGVRKGLMTARSAELEALVPQIKALVEEGLSNPEIAKRVGHELTGQKVANLLCKHGIKRDPAVRWQNAGGHKGAPAADTDSVP